MTADGNLSRLFLLVEQIFMYDTSLPGYHFPFEGGFPFFLRFFGAAKKETTPSFIAHITMKQPNTPSNTPPKIRTPKNRLWWYRKRMGYTQQTVAQLLGHKTTAHVCAYERGKRMPALKTALKLSVILCVPVAFLYPDLHTQLKRTINRRKSKLTKAKRLQ